ncbi:MAG: chloride channel protein [Parcubacteria group bacterium]
MALVERIAGPRLVITSLRRRVRSSEVWLTGLAILAGIAAAVFTLIVGQIAHGLQVALYGFDANERLSAQQWIEPMRLIALPLGGLVVGLSAWWWKTSRSGPPVDVVEANALLGGRMGLRDSAFICAQTLVSNGCGASVGLEAAYAQAGGSGASLLGKWMHLRRADLRTMVAAGAGAGIAAAFGAPLTGAFYAFEVVLGSYSAGTIAPVVGASLAATLIVNSLHNFGEPFPMPSAGAVTMEPATYVLAAGLGVICALLAIVVMRLVALLESVANRVRVHAAIRPAVGGLIVAVLVMGSPQVLSSGRGALANDLVSSLALTALLTLIVLKTMASIVSLGFGFRGGLFFASLFLGSLVGRAYGLSFIAGGSPIGIDPAVAGLAGMSALAAAIIGAPMTMSFLVLETTRDFGLTAACLAASVIAMTIVRERFGYSFSTWRLHLRGETIRSAHDVGWLRQLTAGRLMRQNVPTVRADSTLAEFRNRFPLGSVKIVIALDEADRYAGLVRVALAHAVTDPTGKTVRDLISKPHETLAPDLNIKEIMAAFDRTEADELAVADADGYVLGMVSEAYATRRYAEELEKNRRELTGEV